MPGIYVRKASWIDWTQKGENPSLAVPGSYWLYYKSKIYKFVFRYHRTTRNVKQFNFGRELIKVIRRIIKNQPPQGQQFRTNHLLITFNRTSWTRQDKIFAMMKFKERSVVAFSHAYMLNIKLSYPLEPEQNSKYMVTSSCSDHSLIYQNENSTGTHIYENKNEKESKKCSMHSSKDNYSEKNNQYDNMKEQNLEWENKNIPLNNSMININLKNLSIKKLATNENTSKFCKNLNRSYKVHIESENSIRLNNQIKENSSDCLQDNNIEHQLSFKKVKKENSKLSDDRIKLNEYNTEEVSIKCKDDSISNNSRVLNDNSTNDHTNIDSVNLPYQYLIEEEIENAKQSVKKCKLEEVNKKNSTNYTEVYSDVSKKKKFASENVPRSSDITDLVMEGLMFTIRQGQDTVAVIEQKTKLEVDEVLENSEKIETKGGEQCLRNSSLLGLENLITMIELPKENESGNKLQNIINHEPTLESQSINKHSVNNIEHTLTNDKIKEQNIVSELKHMQQYPLNGSILASTSFSNTNNNLDLTNKCHYSETYDDYKCKEDKKFTTNADLKYKQKEKKTEEEEEEDIIPEALQNEIFESSTQSLKIVKPESKLNFIPTKDLLMDIDNEKLLKFEIDKNEFNPHFNKNSHCNTYSENNCSNYNSIPTNSIINETQTLHYNTICTSKCNDTNKCKLNTPVVISNQIITLNEIPLPLQKILRNKLSIKYKSLGNENKINKDNINIQLENNILDNNVLTSEENHKKCIQNNKETNNESILCSAPKIEVKHPNISESKVKLKEKVSQEQNNSIDKIESPSNKIKDITQEFYKDLSYLQKKNSLMNQKYLRSKRKSLNILNNTNNGDMHIQMVKFFQDITRGAKVVVRRISINKYP